MRLNRSKTMTNIKFNDYLYDNLKAPEYQRKWLRQAVVEYINNGNYEQIFSDLEDVIKANTTITEYAQKVNMDRVQLTKILRGKTKAPNLATINRIISGLGLNYELKCEITLQPKSA